MKQTKTFEILKSLPALGPMYISVSEDDDENFHSEGLAVQFNKSNGENWVANFKPGWTQLKEAIELNSGNVLVISYGTCYIMNPEHVKPIVVFGAGYSKVFHLSDNRILLQDETDITIVEKNETLWHSDSLSNEQIKDLTVDNNVVWGLSCDFNKGEKWRKFSYDLESKVFKYKTKWWQFW
jgi:hypothetical protein